MAGGLRSSVNRHTGYTPNMLISGREINQSVDLMFRTPIGQEKDEMSIPVNLEEIFSGLMK